MSEPVSPQSDHGEPSRDDMMSALFASMVMQQAQMAMLYLGRMPHPETGQPVRDLEAARMFIDHLEMLETKTKGNLGREEAALLKQSLSSVRLAFVQAVEDGSEQKKPEAQPSTIAGGTSTEEKKDEPAPAEAASASKSATDDAEERKKFVKKY